ASNSTSWTSESFSYSPVECFTSLRSTRMAAPLIGHVAARSREACDKTGGNWIRHDYKHDRHCVGRLKQLPGGRTPGGYDEVRRARRQFCRIFADVVEIAAAPTNNEPNIIAFPSQLCKRPRESIEARCRVRTGSARKHTNYSHSIGVLRACRKRPTRD